MGRETGAPAIPTAAAEGSTTLSPGGGRGDQRGHRSGRGFPRGGNQRRSTNPTTTATTASKFEGRCDALKGSDGKPHIYDLSSPRETANTYTKMTEEIAECVGKTCKMGNYNKRSIEEMQEVATVRPAPLASNTDDTDKEIWRQEIAAYVKDKKIVEANMQNAFSLVHDNVGTRSGRSWPESRHTGQ